MNEKFIPLKILNEKGKKEILKGLNEQFGVLSIPGEIFTKGREKLFLFTGNFSIDMIKKIEEITVVERIGIYLAKIDESTGKLRLSIEGSQILGSQIAKNIFEISSEAQAEEWMKGRELNIKSGKKDFLIMKYNDDFLGTGKASEEKISNFIPKNRRLREKSI